MLGAAIGAAVGDDGGGQQQAQDEWYYIDQQGQEQGPFPLETMKNWYQAGYFTAAQRAKCGALGTFRYFAEISIITGVQPTPDVVEPWKKTGIVEAARGVLQAGLGNELVAQPALSHSTAYTRDRAPTWGSAPWRREQEKRELYEQAQAAHLMQARAKVEEAAEQQRLGTAQATIAAFGSDPLALAKAAAAAASTATTAAGAAAAVANAAVASNPVAPAAIAPQRKKKQGGGSFLGSLKSQAKKAQALSTGGMGLDPSMVGLDAKASRGDAFAPVHYQR